MEPRRRELLELVSHGRNCFQEWLEGLKDRMARAAVRKRLDRVEEGNFGDHRAVGAGVSELRIHHGPGYRVYYGEDGPRVVLLLSGGAKATQEQDIRKAQELWAEHRRTR